MNKLSLSLVVFVFSFHCEDTYEPDWRKKYFLKEEMVSVIACPDSFLHRSSANEEIVVKHVSMETELHGPESLWSTPDQWDKSYTTSMKKELFV